ncbi:Uncharacterized protein OS=Singulisphaera acidiphila (strain ATCC BAA-1392 / DSM 18658 / VKM B-2454 / MOB10) GN=Sinac_7312 PE=4 SV=1: DUF4159: DUF4159 [Gemmata massiliana]|uniref:DUF4159 domain-containing protein n=1 Tax=Gemmata massiliana TaxID=1210884 RepID=A0A6P2D5Q2_9BACT|nr:DUF4159 domain-containing protein [Gemmata massiliana]VTR95775.1 Uncharacterized protein OS=Singulisphaera acidiphila (strain ATCC BAA-1392 / DSM 18658 / VKM B-2454 / MOB10) GN=Sinac_7312 PE=4 SV=1: DUF4159: DUF4159 [Gemmata massiliana]
MTRSLLAVGFALCVGLLLAFPTSTVAQPAPAQPRGANSDVELVDKVKKSIDSGVAFLKAEAAKGSGNWETLVLKNFADMDGGATSLAILALLNSGVKVDDPTVKGGLDYLRKITPTKTYVVALQTMALAEAQLASRDKKDLPKLARNAEWFKETAIRSKGKLQGWSYPIGSGSANSDNSNSQYALLGLYAAKTAGVKIEDQLWKEIQEFYARTQYPDKLNEKSGYWKYTTFERDPSFTMTVAGACGLLIASMGLDQSEQQLDAVTGIAAKCGIYSDNTELAKGLFYVGANFNFEEGKSYFYNYYGIERLGRLSGQRFIGRMDWYRAGCVELLKLQQPDGSFAYSAAGARKGIDSNYSVIMTSFALLYLSKGRTPVLVSKFAWGNYIRGEVGKGDQAILTERNPDGAITGVPNWNRKHNDCRNLVEFAQREIFDGAPLSWQVYDMRLQNLSTQAKIDSEVGLLLQSPVVYLNGHGPIPFVTRPTDQALDVAEQILKRYVEEGGFLVAEACCGDKEFAASFEKLVGRLFPGSTLKRVPPEHAIWQMFPGVGPGDFPDLMYLDRGCRTVAIFSPSPLAGYWEERRFMPADGRDPKNRGEKAFCLARNILAYATGMELPKPKLTQTKLVALENTGIARSKFRALQLRYISDASAQQPPASDALRNLMSYLGQHAKLDVALTSEVLAPSDDKLTKFKFMYLHGRKPVQFTPDELDNVKANLQTGGLLLVDAACNDIKQWRVFDQSFREAMAKMFPDQKLVTIPANEPLFRIAAQAGIDIGSVKCRRENAEGTGAEKELRTYPVALEGIKIDGRWVVVYSKYDIGCAIEGHKSADCLGHDKESALRIASAVVLYSLRR